MSRNRSAVQGGARWLAIARISLPVLGLVGMGISGYLAYVYYRWTEPICLEGFDCHTVLFSPYDQIWNIPISLLGFFMYGMVALLGFALLRKPRSGNTLGALGTYIVALSGTLFSVYLTYREFQMQAFCSWCLTSALIMTMILVLSLINLHARGLNFKRILSFSHPRLSEYEATTGNKGEGV